MEVTFANAFGRPGEMPSAKGAQKTTYLLFKVFFALSKVYHALFKVFWVRAEGLLLPLHRRGRGAALCGAFWTRRGLTASRRLGSLRLSRRGYRLPHRAGWLPPFKLPHHGCMSSATRCGTWASTTLPLS